MSSWQPLRPADTSSAPSTLTSLEATPEPEHRAKRKANAGVKVEEVALKLNKFGTVDKTCATPGCDWTLDPTRSIDICVVCEQKRHAEKEKEKLRMILSMRAQGEARPCCAICARAVILPNVVPPTQFIICTICETKMISANAAAGSSKQPPQRHTGTSQSSSRAPSATPSASSSSSSGLKIRLPGSRKVASQAKQAPSPIAAVEVQNPSLKVKIPSKRKASSSSAPMGPPADIPALLSRFATTEKTIEALTNKPHFNEKGELIEYAVSLLSSASASPQKPTPTAESLLKSPQACVKAEGFPSPLRQFTFHETRGPPSTKLVSPFTSPFTTKPLPPLRSVAEPVQPTTTPKQTSPSERPRLTLRLPSRSTLQKAGSSKPSPAAATPGTRPCRRLGCTATLAPAHPWIFCADCLSRRGPKAVSPVDTRSPDDVPHISGGRRASEPHLNGIPSAGKARAAAHARRISEPVIPDFPSASSSASASTRGAKHARAYSDAQSALPTPPPSSRQSSPAPDAPSSPELPLASRRASPRAGARYVKAEEKVPDLWDSDLSELTPLESDAEEEEESASEDEGRGRACPAALGDAGSASTAGSVRAGAAPGGGAGFVCVRSRCQNLLTPWSKWKMCHTCRVRVRERSKERHHAAGLFARAPPAADAGAGTGRVCAIRWCAAALPPASVYRWKLCAACRTRTRRQSRKRKYGEVGLASDEDGEDPAVLGKRRRAAEVGFKTLRLTFRGETVANVEARKKAAAALSMVIADNAQRFPLYQTLRALLDALQERLFGFVTATTHYLRFKMMRDASLDSVQPTVFGFEGEFSVISDPTGGEVGSKIQDVQAEIGKALGITFMLTGFEVKPNGMIVGQYGCVHEVLVPLSTSTLSPPKTPPTAAPLPSTPALDTAPAASPSASPGAVVKIAADDASAHFDVIAKRMVGELTVSVLWDRSHRYFPGLRTIIHFSLVG